MESNFLSGGIEELTKAKEAITEAGELQAAYDAAAADASGKEKDLESQKKYVQDKINGAIKERRGELKKTHDEQVDLANKNLKEAEKKRKAAKLDAVQARISDETAELVARNELLKKASKETLKENQMPGFCNTAYYYALFAPKRGIDFVVFVITVILAFGAVPNIVCALMKTDKLILKILVYIAIVVFFVAVYFLIYAISKRNKKGPVIEQVRLKRTEIRNNKSQIRKMSKSIIKDKDESLYDLDGYDTEITSLQQIYNDTVQKREDALKVFDEETAQQIRDEIQRENQETLDQMEETLNASKIALEEAKGKATAAAENVSGSYEVYLGKKNTSVEKIDGLITLIQEGKATTIMEALDILNGEIK